MVKMEETEKNFFGDIDKRRQSVTPAWTVLIIILVLFFSLSIYGLIRVRSAFKNINFDGWNIDSSLPKLSLSSRIADLSKNGGSFNLTLNSTELSAYLNLSDDSFPLKNTYAKINPGQVVIYGRLKSSRLGLPASITLKPEVADGNLKFSSQPTDLEKIYMSEDTQNKIASAFSNRISFDLNLSGKTKVDRVTAEDNLLTIFISPK
jgi:hypothetical protein